QKGYDDLYNQDNIAPACDRSDSDEIDDILQCEKTDVSVDSCGAARDLGNSNRSGGISALLKNIF
ncbi:MAG: hypothetical protein JXA66_03030, partial [Oligoflexia bacterium]|nr:hypothetical protein [Oligoflexia bacterium]